MVVTLVVVIAHITLVLVELDALFDADVCSRAAALVLDVVGVGAAAVVSLGLV